MAIIKSGKSKALVTALIVITLLTGCDPTSKMVRAKLSNSFDYDKFSCLQLKEELANVKKREEEESIILDTKASDDDTVATLGVLLFWPFLLLLRDNTEEVERLAETRGTIFSLEKTMVYKNCVTLSTEYL